MCVCYWCHILALQEALSSELRVEIRLSGMKGFLTNSKQR